MIKLTAWNGAGDVCELSRSQAVGMAATELVDATPGVGDRQWLLKTGSQIGVAIGPQWELRVAPKIEIHQLMFLLGFAGQDGWHEDEATFETELDFFAAIASGFSVLAERAISPTPLHGYVQIDETSHVLRGRIRFADQIARRPGVALPLEIRHDDFSMDIVENRLLLGATEQLLGFPRVHPATRSRLLRVRAALDGVVATRPAAHISVPTLTRLNDHYGSAMRLAQRILQSTSLSTSSGTQVSTAFVFDMNRVFEDFLTRALDVEAARRGAVLVSQGDGLYLDRERGLPLKPDITIRRAGVTVAVVDAKYKPLASASFPNADAYQMLAYCIRYGLDQGTLVYAQDDRGGRRDHEIHNAGVTVHVRSLDLAASHGEVMAQVARLADELVDGARVHAVA